MALVKENREKISGPLFLSYHHNHFFCSSSSAAAIIIHKNPLLLYFVELNLLNWLKKETFNSLRKVKDKKKLMQSYRKLIEIGRMVKCIKIIINA